MIARVSIAPGISDTIASLKACDSPGELQAARKIHAAAAQRGDALNAFVANTLVDTYGRCGSMEDARRFFFEGIAGAVDVVSWNSLIGGYAHNGQGKRGLEMFSAMLKRGFAPNARTFVAALKACAGCAEKENSSGKSGKLDCLAIARSLHSQAAMRGFQSDIYVANTLVDTYVRCGSLEDARRVFDKIENRSIVSWTAMMMGYAQGGSGELALELFLRMEESGCKPNARTYVAALKACTDIAAKDEDKQRGLKLRSLEKGMSLHSRLASCGYESQIFVVSTLVDMYAKCGSLDDASRAFWRASNRDLVLWNAMVMAYAQGGEGELALECFCSMQQPRTLGNISGRGF